MFSSPAIRIFNVENAENMVQRKPGNNVPTRKPFVDRTVNSRTPDKNLRSPFQKFQQPATKDKEVLKEDLSCEEFIYSRKQAEEFNDSSWSHAELTKNTLHNLQKFCGRNFKTPPPSPEMELPDFFTTLPEPLSMSSLFFSQPMVEECQEVDVPHIDFDLDDLDMSV